MEVRARWDLVGLGEVRYVYGRIGEENWMGRPKMANRKTRTVKVRMTEEDYNMFTYLCEKTNKTKSDLFRIALIEYMERVKKWY